MKNPLYLTIERKHKTSFALLLFYLEQLCVIIYLPVQINPSPVKPILQAHVLVPPITLVHCAFAEHPPLLIEHSLISKKRNICFYFIM